MTGFYSYLSWITVFAVLCHPESLYSAFSYSVSFILFSELQNLDVSHVRALVSCRNMYARAIPTIITPRYSKSRLYSNNETEATPLSFTSNYQISLNPYGKPSNESFGSSQGSSSSCGRVFQRPWPRLQSSGHVEMNDCWFSQTLECQSSGLQGSICDNPRPPSLYQSHNSVAKQPTTMTHPHKIMAHPCASPETTALTGMTSWSAFHFTIVHIISVTVVARIFKVSKLLYLTMCRSWHADHCKAKP